MYEEFLRHFGLERNPFAVSPNLQSFHSTTAHDQALLQLVFGAETGKGLMVLTGEPGTGKTTILLYFLDWLQQRLNYSTAYVFHTSLPSMDLLRLILRDFGIPSDAPSKGELLIALTDWLKERRRAGDCPVVVIDEAQALTSTALEELRLLLNLESGGVKLVQIVLAGQPLLDEKLRLPQMAQLRQRVMCHCRLPPFTPDETAGYIVKRLTWAGLGDSGLFPPETVREIFKYSKGIPRVINLICEHALLSSYADRRNSVHLDDVAAVAQEFELDEEVQARKMPSQTNMFCRLSSFPELGVKDAEVRSKHKEVAKVVTPTATPSETEKELADVPAVPNLAVVEPLRVLPVPGNASRPEPTISRVRSVVSTLSSHFSQYWRVVARSFASDANQFFAQCLGWWSKLKVIARSGTTTRNGMVRSLRSWLLSPMGSTTVAPHRQRKY